LTFGLDKMGDEEIPAAGCTATRRNPFLVLLHFVFHQMNPEGTLDPVAKSGVVPG
jgi:hypothetical protein